MSIVSKGPVAMDEHITETGYDPFAWFYEAYWGREIARDFLDALKKLLLPLLGPQSAILDLCCGTGRVVAELHRLEFKVTGLDSSQEMLSYAQRNAPSAELLLADARSFETVDRFNAVISTFDSLNHMMSLKELSSVFQNVFNCMATGGLFFFDMNLERGFRRNWQEEFSVVDDDKVCVVKGHYDKAARIGKYQFTLFRPDGENWTRSDFTILQRCYRRNQIERALKSAGFSNITVFDAERDAGLTEHSGRIFVLAQKP
jgi:SAM-dependent methyltransferase